MTESRQDSAKRDSGLDALQALPNERFSGLQLMCLMHVGLKRVEPSLDPETGLDDAYSRALSLYQPGNR
jgi:hypothetical protein